MNSLFENPAILLRVATINLYPESLANQISEIRRSLKQIDLTDCKVHFDSLAQLFMNCYNLEAIKGIESLDVEGVDDMDEMFLCAQSLKHLDLQNWQTSNVVNMHNMFMCASSLETLNLAHWDVSNVADMIGMFSNCYKLKRLDVSDWVLTKDTKIDNIFGYCPADMEIICKDANTKQLLQAALESAKRG